MWGVPACSSGGSKASWGPLPGRLAQSHAQGAVVPTAAPAAQPPQLNRDIVSSTTGIIIIATAASELRTRRSQRRWLRKHMGQQLALAQPRDKANRRSRSLRVAMSATPRQVQFGLASAVPSSDQTDADGNEEEDEEDDEPVRLPLNRLHAMVAERHLPHLMAEVPDRNVRLVLRDWGVLLTACQQQAPGMLQYWNSGVGPLLRLAALVPREEWVRCPSEPWAADVVPGKPHDRSEAGAFGAVTVEGPNEGAEMLPYLEALVQHVLCKFEMPRGLAVGLVWNDGAGGCMREIDGREVVMSSAVGINLCSRFVKLLARVGGGEKPMAAAKELIHQGLTKKMVSHLIAGNSAFPSLTPVEAPDDVRHVQPPEVALAGPLAAIRKAQVASLGGPEWIAVEVVRGSKLGKDLGTEEEEEWFLAVLGWVVQFADAPELAEQGAVAKAVEWLVSQRSLDPDFSLYVAGNARTPKKVLAAAERAAASLELQRLQTSGRRFQSNTAGIKGFVRSGVTTAFGSPFTRADRRRSRLLESVLEKLGANAENLDISDVPVPNSWQGDEYEPSEEEAEYLRDPANQRRATVRIDEIMTFEYLQHVGDRMKNCLRAERRGGRSLVKYLRRVEARQSSFWVMTITAEASEEDPSQVEEVEELLLIEVYNDLRVIHQAEGPHPRRWPRPDAWAWLREWAEREGLRPDGPEGVTIGPYGGRGLFDMFDGDETETRRSERSDDEAWNLNRCFLW